MLVLSPKDCIVFGWLFFHNPQGFINWDLSEEAGHIKPDQSDLRYDLDLLDSLSKNWGLQKPSLFGSKVPP